jgi:hypothetical protein
MSSVVQFLIQGLAASEFAPLFALDAAALSARHIQGRTVTEAHDAPCRVSLLDAEPGEQVLLLPFAHHALATPYRSSGPIFVRRGATTATLAPGAVPDSLRRRLLALRAYDAAGWMLGCDVVQGDQLVPVLERMLKLEGCAFVNLHYARAGCYAARATLA